VEVGIRLVIPAWRAFCVGDRLISFVLQLNMMVLLGMLLAISDNDIVFFAVNYTWQQTDSGKNSFERVNHIKQHK